MRFCEPLTDIRLQNERIKNSDSVKYLDTKISFDVHFDKAERRLSNHVFAVARIRKFAIINVLNLFYSSFIEPIILYGRLI